jgi:hypothetical protein
VGTLGASVEINNGGRIRAVLERSAFFNREVAIGAGEAGSFRGGAITEMASEERLLCNLRTSANTLISAHLTLLRGGLQTWTERVPRQTGWPAVELDTECSALTPVAGVFRGSIEGMRGVRGRSARLQTLLYRNNCLSDLQWENGGVAIASKPRVQPYKAFFSPDLCVHYNAGDHVAQEGLHALLLRIEGAYQAVVGALEAGMEDPAAMAALSANPAFGTIEKYQTKGSTELQLGVLRLVLEVLAETQGALEANTPIVILLVTGAALVALAQHVALSRQLGRIISENVGMSMTVERLLNYTIYCTKEVANRRALAAGGHDGDGFGDDDDYDDDSVDKGFHACETDGGMIDSVRSADTFASRANSEADFSEWEGERSVGGGGHAGGRRSTAAPSDGAGIFNADDLEAGRNAAKPRAHELMTVTAGGVSHPAHAAQPVSHPRAADVAAALKDADRLADQQEAEDK